MNDTRTELLAILERIEADTHAAKHLVMRLFIEARPTRSVASLPCDHDPQFTAASSGVYVPEDVVEHIDACGE